MNKNALHIILIIHSKKCIFIKKNNETLFKIRHKYGV